MSQIKELIKELNNHLGAPYKRKLNGLVQQVAKEQRIICADRTRTRAQFHEMLEAPSPLNEDSHE